MSASLQPACPPERFRFGNESTVGNERSVQWLLKRNCSMAPRQLLMFYGSLCLLSLVIGGFCWSQGATLVLPFTSLELLTVGTALFVYARHATDNDSIRLAAGRLTVERASGGRVERVDFVPEWVRVEPGQGGRALIALSAQGRTISVGRFVRPELRRQLAEELRWALRRWQLAAGAAPAL